MPDVSDPPDSAVFEAFAADPASAVLMEGGRGRAWRARDVVLRPADAIEEATWKAELLDTLRPDAGFRTARPIRDRDGNWVRDGWEAWEWLEGAADESRVAEIIEVAALFHRAMKGVTRPGFIARSMHEWARADRMAWGEGALPDHPVFDRLARAWGDVSGQPQLIHGDLLGNVLFAPGLAPAIIDWAPYWRPAGLGAAIAVVDAATWHRLDSDRLGKLGAGIPDWRQLLVRALTFRIASRYLLGARDELITPYYLPVVEAVLSQ